MLTSASSCEEGKLQLATEVIDVYRSFGQWSLKEASSVPGSCWLHAQRGLFLEERIYLPRALHSDAYQHHLPTEVMNPSSGKHPGTETSIGEHVFN